MNRNESKDLSKRISEEVRQRTAAEIRLGTLEIDLKHALNRAETAERTLEALQARSTVPFAVLV